jgi:hypothetical protein
VTLANNLSANAADVLTVHASHNGRAGASRQGPLLAPVRLPNRASQPAMKVFGSRRLKKI